MKWVGWGLLIFGAAGVYYRYTLFQASAQGNPALTNQSLKMFDPAGYLGLQPGTGLVDLPMGVNGATAALGIFLLTRG